MKCIQSSETHTIARKYEKLSKDNRLIRAMRIIESCDISLAGLIVDEGILKLSFL